MTSITSVVNENGKWFVKVNWGFFTEGHGPYRWKWVATIVSWWLDGIH